VPNITDRNDLTTTDRDPWSARSPPPPPPTSSSPPSPPTTCGPENPIVLAPTTPMAGATAILEYSSSKPTPAVLCPNCGSYCPVASGAASALGDENQRRIAELEAQVSLLKKTAADGTRLPPSVRLSHPLTSVLQRQQSAPPPRSPRPARQPRRGTGPYRPRRTRPPPPRPAARRASARSCISAARPPRPRSNPRRPRPPSSASSPAPPPRRRRRRTRPPSRPGPRPSSPPGWPGSRTSASAPRGRRRR
jgi:hypothetical protein